MRVFSASNCAFEIGASIANAVPAQAMPAPAKSATRVRLGLCLSMVPPGSVRADVVAVGLRPAVDLRVGLVLGDAVALLDLAGELVALAGDDVEVVVGEPA